jgi:hypothetical protein
MAYILNIVFLQIHYKSSTWRTSFGLSEYYLMLHLNLSKLNIPGTLLHLNLSKLNLPGTLLHLNLSKLNLPGTLLHLNLSKLNLPGTNSVFGMAYLHIMQVKLISHRWYFFQNSVFSVDRYHSILLQ